MKWKRKGEDVPVSVKSFISETSQSISINFGMVTYVITEVSGEFCIIYFRPTEIRRPKIHEAQSNVISFV
jgi:hypothetical protein